jgi:hypothetical protein
VVLAQVVYVACLLGNDFFVEVYQADSGGGSLEDAGLPSDRDQYFQALLAG